MEKSFSVVITGVRSGVEVEDVAARVARIFQLEESALSGLHHGKPVIMVSGVSEDEALKQKEILRRSGCLVEISSDSDLDPAEEFKALQDKLYSLLIAADKLTGSKKRTDNFAAWCGAVLVAFFAAGWYFTTWYWGLLVLVPVGIAVTVLTGRHNLKVAGEFFSALKPGLIDLVGKNGAMGLAAIAALRKESVFHADRKLIETDEAQEKLKEFLGETRRNRSALYEKCTALEELLKAIPSLVNKKVVELKAQIEEIQAVNEKLQKDLEEMGKTRSKIQVFPAEPDPCEVSAPSGGFSYSPPAELYYVCMLKEGQSDIILPPIDAGNLRYTKPASKRLLNSFDIGGGLTVAFTQTHFIMALARSFCWRIGYDCVRSYRYSGKSNGEGLPSGREHEMEFSIGLEHTYTDTPTNQISAFGFNLTWWKIPGIAEYCVPRIKDAIEKAGVPRCPACGGNNLAIGSWSVTTGVFSEEQIPSDSATCLDCGINMVYARSAGGWMAATDADMHHPAPPLSADRDEMILQVKDVLYRAENMISAVSVARERFMRKVEAMKEERQKANLGITFGNMRYATMNSAQRNAYLAGRNVQNSIPVLEYTQGLMALMFNFNSALSQIEKRLKEDSLSTGELLERSIRCKSVIDGFYASLPESI